MKPFLITIGEPAGIGPDCIIRAWNNSKNSFQDSIVVAPACWLIERATAINSPINCMEFPHLDDAVTYGNQHSDILCCWNPLSDQHTGPVSPGLPSPVTAAAVLQCIETAAVTCIDGKAAAMVTGPIEKAVLKTAGFQFPGHTEFLAHLARNEVTASVNSDFVMMLASETLRVALLTTHMALKEVPESISINTSLDCIRIVYHDLKSRFGIDKPRLGLCGLNPHAGEQGHFGREEIDILAPAAAIALQEGIDIRGPLPADTLFSSANRRHFDAIICCYHDQALIPIKALSFGDAINVTLGLPFIRTSVDHGTALDLVGSESVSSTSLLQAIKQAKQMASCQ